MIGREASSPALRLEVSQGMRLRKRSPLVLALLILAESLLGGSPRPDALRVVTTVFPLNEFARIILSDRGNASLLIPPGADVHTWQPRVSDILRLSSADLLIQVGAGLEPWTPGLVKSAGSPKLRTLAVADSLPLEKRSDEDEGEAGLDPHDWLDFGLAMMIADLIAAELARIDPSDGPFFQARAADLKVRLRELDRAYAQGLAGCTTRTLVIAGHAAFGYLARRYGLEQLALSGLSPDAEALPSRLMAAIAWGKEHKVRAVFTEANASPRMAKVLAKELQVDVMILHTAAKLNKKEWESKRSFFDIMEENLRNLRRGLGCE